MTAPRTIPVLRRAESKPSADEDLMDVLGLMLGSTLFEISAVNPNAENRIRAFLEEALEQDFARDHALAVRSITAALDEEAVGMVLDLIDAGDLADPIELVGASRARN